MADLTREERLAAYLSQAARRRLDYATGWDCAAGFVAGWVEQERGVDGAKPWRGRYRTALGVARLLRREGGLVAVVGRGAALAGLEPVESPGLGDIGVVLAETLAGRQPVGAIRTARRWAMLTPGGVRSSSRATALAAWGV